MSNRYEPYSRDRDHDRDRDRDRGRDRDRNERHVGPMRDKHPMKPTPNNNAPLKKPSSASQMFVSGIKDLDDKALRSYFSQFGQITECRVMTDKQTGQPKGFGFISFIDPSIAERIINSGQTHNIQGKMVQTKPGGQNQNQNANPSHPVQHTHTSSGSSSTNVTKITKPTVNPTTTPKLPTTTDEVNEGEDAELTFTPIVGLGWVEAGCIYRPMGEEEQLVDAQGGTIYIMCSSHVTEDILYDQFEGYGEISKCTIIPDKRNQALVYGFITFTDPRSAQSSIGHMDGLLLLDSQMRVLQSLPSHIKNPHPPLHFVKNLAFSPMDANAKMIPPPSSSSSEEGGIVDEESEDPEVIKARELRLKMAVAEGVKAAQSAMKEIDSRLEDFSKTRQYNPDEYDY
eukprot:TRINITY_DN1879_c0_g1_i3.p2 TRINITY_DN1879_c0_g1~~TRINITY_DN1879_c0_g1_i3.p2  ORF type:complete len:399 (-),score=91.67 TRINITY_DN1879_c0_g1_i3:83-1279(-)